MLRFGFSPVENILLAAHVAEGMMLPDHQWYGIFYSRFFREFKRKKWSQVGSVNLSPRVVTGVCQTCQCRRLKAEIESIGGNNAE